MFKEFAISLGIISLAAAYLLYTGQQYFSQAAMFQLLLLAAISALSFIVSSYPGRTRQKVLLAFLAAIVLIISVYEIAFLRIPLPVIFPYSAAFLLVPTASAISVGLLYLFGKVRTGTPRCTARLGLAILGFAILISTAAYLVMYLPTNLSWNGVDELAFNYYSAWLFLHGSNPYAVSMGPILQQYHISPTVMLNGTFELTYDYPALSFLAYVPMLMLGAKSFFVFIWILIFFAALASLVIYVYVGPSRRILLPIFVWFMVTYSLVSVSNTYLAISIFAFFAYVVRRRPFASGALLGLAASVTPLAWFVLPFFYVLTSRKNGLRAAGVQVLASILLFGMVNAYFFVLSPGAFTKNIFEILLLGKLPPYGINATQFFAAFYAVPPWYISVLSLSVYFFLLYVFYSDVEKHRYLLALVPMFIFFLSWRNITVYAMPFVPLLLLTLYEGRKDTGPAGSAEVRAQTSYGNIALAAALLLALIALMAYSHNGYVAESKFSITRIYPVLYPSPYYPGHYSLSGLLVNLSSNSKTNETLTFYVVSRSPDQEGYVLGSTLPRLAPMSSRLYLINYTLPLVNNKTGIFLMVFSQDYLSSRTLRLTNLSASP